MVIKPTKKPVNVFGTENSPGRGGFRGQVGKASDEGMETPTMLQSNPPDGLNIKEGRPPLFQGARAGAEHESWVHPRERTGRSRRD